MPDKITDYWTDELLERGHVCLDPVTLPSVASTGPYWSDAGSIEPVQAQYWQLTAGLRGSSHLALMGRAVYSAIVPIMETKTWAACSSRFT